MTAVATAPGPSLPSWHIKIRASRACAFAATSARRRPSAPASAPLRLLQVRYAPLRQGLPGPPYGQVPDRLRSEPSAPPRNDRPGEFPGRRPGTDLPRHHLAQQRVRTRDVPPRPRATSVDL